jgi:bifunctional non-homologous end joining protein LigD
MGLKKYFAKRDFKKTPEPRGKARSSGKKLIFVIQKHHARRLHYDFRLEFGGTLKSWAVPKGPSLNPKDKRLAVEVEDHPVDYATFEGDIPKEEYGGGHVIVWDYGYWTPPENVNAALKKGHLDFELEGEKLQGKWSLIRLRSDKTGKNNWLLFKRQDDYARTDYDIVEEEPDSVINSPRKEYFKKTTPQQVEKLIAKNKKKSKKAVSGKKLKAPPEFVPPQLAQLVTSAPNGREWLHEMKFDGYRNQCRIYNGHIQMLTRSGIDWADKYGSLTKEIEKLPTDNALLDGEIIWVDDQGHSNFQGLQNALSEKSYGRLVYYVFDILHLDGEDLRDKLLYERKEILKNLLSGLGNSKILYSEHWTTGAQHMIEQACKLQLEGIVSKDADAPYSSGRDMHWQKTKCSLRQEFVIGGYAESTKDRPFSGLLMGVYDKNGKLRYAGKVGTGFTEESLREIEKKLKPLETDKSPFDIRSPRSSGIHWVKPKLAAEVEFKAWTGDGSIRQGSFQGLRTDKDTKKISKEIPMKPKTKISKDPLVAGIKITHPDRIVYPQTDTKKIEVIHYYEGVHSLMQPFMKDRPLSLLRCQDTTGDTCFFQKHAEGRNLDARSKPVHYKDKEDTALLAETKEEMIQLVQAGTIEFHAWGAKFKNITKPDLIVFDLDPETKSLWPVVVETAHTIRAMLKQLDLESFVKVTGGKGLHIHVPIKPLYDWDQIKDFSKSLMVILEQREPKKYTTNMNKARRKGRIFLDYLRNGYGATAVLPYTLRAREYPTIAVPIAWKDLKVSLKPDGFTIDDLAKIKKRKDPWAGFWDLSQSIQVLKPAKKETSSEARIS